MKFNWLLLCHVSILSLAQVVIGHEGDASSAEIAQHPKCHGTKAPGLTKPLPRDPYPVMAGGWGPQLGQGRFYSRWVEDWRGMRETGLAPHFKAVPLGGEASLSLSAEVRLRHNRFHNGLLARGEDYTEGLFRGMIGAELRYNRFLRFYSEIGTGQATGEVSDDFGNFQNEALLHQAFVEARGFMGSTMLGLMVGRQEFSDGPRQLLSLGNGPNIHRSWNGVRGFLHRSRFRIGIYDLRASERSTGAFDDGIAEGERLRGISGSVILSQGIGPNTYLEPFWIHSEDPEFRMENQMGFDDRHTFGTRLWGRLARYRFDATLARQTGHWNARDVRAWGAFIIQSLTLSERGWQPQLTLRIDLASGDNSQQSGIIRSFNPLYASNNYLSQGLFLSLSNLALYTPGIVLKPSKATKLSLSYGIARRMTQEAAAVAGLMRNYPGTEDMLGHELGRLLRIEAKHQLNRQIRLFFGHESFNAGTVLNRANIPSATHTYIGVNYHY